MFGSVRRRATVTSDRYRQIQQARSGAEATGERLASRPPRHDEQHSSEPRRRRACHGGATARSHCIILHHITLHSPWPAGGTAPWLPLWSRRPLRMRNTVLFTCGWPGSRHSASASVAPAASAAAAVAASAAAASAALVRRWTRTARSASLGQKCASRERREGGMREPQSGDVYALFFTASPLLSSLLLSFFSQRGNGVLMMCLAPRLPCW